MIAAASEGHGNQEHQCAMRTHAHNRRSIRLKEYDYSMPGGYFVTICTIDKIILFGEIINGEMQLSPQGMIAQQCWDEIPQHFHNVELDAFVCMPNHVHGIINIYDTTVVGTRHAVSLQGNEHYAKPVHGSLSTIVRSYKSAATKRIHEINNTPHTQIWQPRFYEHVVRGEKDLHNIRRYILGNPSQWESDEEYPPIISARHSAD